MASASACRSASTVTPFTASARCAVFVNGWWGRYGTAEVKSGDLYDIAAGSEPPLPLGPGNDKSQRTRLGKALGRMRDRVFRIGERDVRLTAAGVDHQAQLWRLALVGERGERGERFPGSDFVASGERWADEGNVESERSPEQVIDTNGVGERGERGERFLTLTHAHTRAHVKEEPEKPSPRSPRSPEAEKSEAYAGERAGERLSSPSPPSRTPSGRIRASWELPPEPPPPDRTWKKQPRSPLFKDGQPIPHWLAEVME